VEDFRGVMTDVQGVVEGVRAGRGTIGQLFTDDTLSRRINEIGGEVQLTMKNVREATDHGRVMMDRLAGPDGSAQRVMRTLQDTLTQAQEVVSDLGEGTEALKRNFLFRGFFRDRGFYDLDAITRDAYLGGALENDRTALRVWIEGDLLFARGPDGIERLTESGRRRIDAAMADLVRFPRDSPLVIEGYAQEDQGQGVHLASADRAVLVRDYIVERFRRKATLVDTMAMGSSARHSPRGTGEFSGVALALFVRNAALMGVVR
jgi:phospholipid/cholesterol/gamma-HCH transport system substrate-binding protein